VTDEGPGHVLATGKGLGDGEAVGPMLSAGRDSTEYVGLQGSRVPGFLYAMRRP
jgi:hypothetical protein